MASTLIHTLLTLLASLLLCCSPCTLAAPAREVRQTQNPVSHLLAGLQASVTYSLRRSPSGLPVVSASDPRIEIILGQLCDVLAYYYFAVKVDDSSDLQAILKANAKNACQWLKYLHTSEASVSCNPEPPADSSCSLEEVTYLHQYCLRKKIFSFSESLLRKASQAARNFYSSMTSVCPSTWADENLSEPHKSNIQAILPQCS